MFDNSFSYVKFREQEESANKRAQMLAEDQAEAQALDREVLVGNQVITIQQAHEEIDRMTYLMEDIISFLDKTQFVTNGELHTMMNAHQYLRNTRNYISDQVTRQYPDMKDSFYTV